MTSATVRKINVPALPPLPVRFPAQLPPPLSGHLTLPSLPTISPCTRLQTLDFHASIVSNGDVEPYMASDAQPWIPVAVGHLTGYYSPHHHKVVDAKGTIYTPTGFECAGGKENNRKWRLSLRYGYLLICLTAPTSSHPHFNPPTPTQINIECYFPMVTKARHWACG